MSIGGALAEEDGGILGVGNEVYGALDGVGIRSGLGYSVDGLEEKFLGLCGVHDLTEGGSSHVDVYAAGTAGDGGAVGAGDGGGDVLGVAAAEGGLDEGTGGV